MDRFEKSRAASQQTAALFFFEQQHGVHAEHRATITLLLHFLPHRRARARCQAHLLRMVGRAFVGWAAFRLGKVAGPSGRSLLAANAQKRPVFAAFRGVACKCPDFCPVFFWVVSDFGYYHCARKRLEARATGGPTSPPTSPPCFPNDKPCRRCRLESRSAVRRKVFTSHFFLSFFQHEKFYFFAQDGLGRYALQTAPWGFGEHPVRGTLLPAALRQAGCPIT